MTSPDPIQKAVSDRPVRVLRVIARLNMGGPAKHVGLLSGRRMNELGYETILVHGSLAPGEDPLLDVAEQEGAQMMYVPDLKPPINPVSDLKALVKLVAVVRKFRPDVVHTHTAKGGFLGRAAALGVWPRPIVVHTYHGHVLEGYFSRAKTAVYRTLERAAAKVSDLLIGVSQATVDDLVRLRVSAPEKFKVVPLGLDLDRFAEIDPVPDLEVRRQIGIDDGGLLFVYVGRIAPIKRLDVLLSAVGMARRDGADIGLAIVGDGEARSELEELSRQLGIESSVHFLGYRSDLERINAAADAVVLSSDNEGTPVCLIEAAASARPVVTTDVGGVRDVVTDRTGIVVPANDPAALSEGMVTLARDADLRSEMGSQARQHALSSFSADRLVRDIDGVYKDLINHRRSDPAAGEST